MKWCSTVRIRRVLLLASLTAALASCGTVQFYAQAARGQAQMLWRARPISKVIAEPSTKPGLRRRLELVQRLQTFAGKDLGLPANAIFTRYADLGRRYAVWVVYASPEFSMEAKGWWYPLVGTLKYRGFFDEASAKAEARSLKDQGYDVLMAGVEAYSTLGWFSDPVLNTFIERGEGDLAELIFHELTHVRLFLPGDTDFNEALATAVGQEGARRWFASRHEPDKLKAYEQELAKDDEIVHLLLRTREELEQLYKTHHPATEMRREKAQVLAVLQTRYQELRRRWQGDSRYDRLLPRPRPRLHPKDPRSPQRPRRLLPRDGRPQRPQQEGALCRTQRTWPGHPCPSMSGSRS
jgi:predicted aminopeptidase